MRWMNVTHDRPFPDKVAEWNERILQSAHKFSEEAADSVGDDTLIRDF